MESIQEKVITTLAEMTALLWTRIQQGHFEQPNNARGMVKLHHEFERLSKLAKDCLSQSEMQL